MDQFKKVTNTSWGKRLSNSIGGIFVGIALFIGSFFVLYINEGRLDLSTIVKTAPEININNVESNQEFNSQLVTATGKLESTETLSDTFLKGDNYLFLDRITQMYSWEENVSSNSRTNTGGSETTETTYSYQKVWAESPMDSSKFEYPTDHTNPAKSIESLKQRATTANIGQLQLDLTQITPPNLNLVQLNNENVILSSNSKLENNYIFQGAGTITEPVVGDIKISYYGIKHPILTATVIGKLDTTSSTISAYTVSDNSLLYRVFVGTKDNAIKTLSNEYKTQLWTFRVVGFLMMWTGLTLIFKVISVFLDFFPTVGYLSRNLINGVLFVIAGILSTTTILISIILQNPIVLIITVIVILLISGYFIKRKSALK